MATKWFRRKRKEDSETKYILDGEPSDKIFNITDFFLLCKWNGMPDKSAAVDLLDSMILECMISEIDMRRLKTSRGYVKKSRYFIDLNGIVTTAMRNKEC